MRLTARDAFSTLFVGAAAVLYALWVTGTAASGVSARIMTVVLFALGIAACTSNKPRMMDVYGADGTTHAAIPYVVVVSAIGGIALVAAVVGFVTGAKLAAGVLVAAVVVLWAVSTLRHTIVGATHGSHVVGGPAH